MLPLRSASRRRRPRRRSCPRTPRILHLSDISTGILVLEAIDRVNRELGTTTAVITHNAAVSAMANRVVSLADGRVTSTRINASRRAPRELEW